MNKQIQSNLPRISFKGQVQAKLLLKMVTIYQNGAILAYSRSDFSIWKFVLGAKKKLFASLPYTNRLSDFVYAP